MTRREKQVFLMVDLLLEKRSFPERREMYDRKIAQLKAAMDGGRDE